MSLLHITSGFGVSPFFILSIAYNNVVIKDTRLTLDQIEGRTVDLELVIRPADKDNLYKKFELCFAENEKYHSTLCFRPDESVLKIDRKFSV